MIRKLYVDDTWEILYIYIIKVVPMFRNNWFLKALIGVSALCISPCDELSAEFVAIDNVCMGDSCGGILTKVSATTFIFAVL